MVKNLKFKAYCVEHNIKQKDVAKVINLSIPNTCRKMNGHDPFTLEQIKKICETYGISADEYFM